MMDRAVKHANGNAFNEKWGMNALDLPLDADFLVTPDDGSAYALFEKGYSPLVLSSIDLVRNDLLEVTQDRRVILLAGSNEKSWSGLVAGRLSPYADTIDQAWFNGETLSAWLTDHGAEEDIVATLKSAVTWNSGYAALQGSMFNAADLLRTKFPPIKYVVPGYLPEGLTVLAGKPKIGKSWLALDISLAVALGGCAMGSVMCEPGDCLYAALEDNPRRLQSRLFQILPDDAVPDRLTLAQSWPKLDEGGLDALHQWYDSAHNPRLVIFDTLQRVRSEQPERKTNYQADWSSPGLMDTFPIVKESAYHAENEDPVPSGI